MLVSVTKHSPWSTPPQTGNICCSALSSHPPPRETGNCGERGQQSQADLLGTDGVTADANKKCPRQSDGDSNRNGVSREGGWAPGAGFGGGAARPFNH